MNRRQARSKATPRLKSRTGTGGRRGPRLSIALCEDVSNSMYGKKLEDAKEALCAFVKKTDLKQHEVGLVVFGSRENVEVAHPLTGDSRSIIKAIQQFEVYGGTPLLGALEVAEQLLTGAQGKPVIVVATDGGATDALPKEVLEYGARLKKKGVRIVTVAIGADASKNFLVELASSPEDFHEARVSGQLVETYQKIASRLVAKE